MGEILLALFTLALASPPAFGQARDFPVRPIRAMVSFTAGSGSDTASRRC